MRIIVVGGGTIGKAAVKALIAVLHCVEDDDRGNPSASGGREGERGGGGSVSTAGSSPIHR